MVCQSDDGARLSGPVSDSNDCGRALRDYTSGRKVRPEKSEREHSQAKPQATCSKDASEDCEGPKRLLYG